MTPETSRTCNRTKTKAPPLVEQKPDSYFSTNLDAKYDNNREPSATYLVLLPAKKIKF
jgi:hypothetical protein